MRERMTELGAIGLVVLMTAVAPLPIEAQLAADWMVPAAAHNRGSQDTFWKTDLSLHNPHEFDLPVVIQALPSDTVNLEVPTLTFTIYPWETINLWDVLGPDVFDVDGTAAIIAYADPALRCDPIEDCHFLVTSRTYTPEKGGDGEYGLTVPGAAISRATDWSTFGYAAGVLNDGDFFRCNAGVASWTPDWTRVRLDIQDSDGQIVSSEVFDLPPYGHVQRRLATSGYGSSLVFYLESGPDDASVFPYATVINQQTGDSSYLFASSSTVGVSVAKNLGSIGARPEGPSASTRVVTPVRRGRKPAHRLK
ncbi:MAG: hypothetical protein OEV48_05025 [Acidobacteriota bacterium]|nr:hypothetical protein [Acidobacteriota bacterium]